MEYIYRIHNLITNKDYVGLTNNPKRRESRHFTDLKYGRHDNPHLQRAYNKYGREAFVYEVLQTYDCSEEEIKEYEKEWIEKLDSYHNGYNCNPGGDLSYIPGKLREIDVYQILSVTDKLERQGKKLAEIYGVSVKVISNVRTRKSYNLFCENYDKLPQSEKDRLFVLMNSEYHFTKEINKGTRKFTREQVYMIYLYRDYKLPFTQKSILENFKMSDTTAALIKKGERYNDYYNDYYKLNLEDKNKILCAYTGMYKLNPFELLENPNVKPRAISSEASNEERSTTIP